jgi:hypothetical protein
MGRGLNRSQQPKFRSPPDVRERGMIRRPVLRDWPLRAAAEARFPARLFRHGDRDRILILARERRIMRFIESLSHPCRLRALKQPQATAEIVSGFGVIRIEETDDKRSNYRDAGAGGVGGGRDERGLYLRDAEDSVARPGDAIDAENVFKPQGADFGDMLAAGWPISHDCARGLAIVHSIDRVHR